MSYTNGLDDPTLYFNTKLYTGTGATHSITGVGFQPDWVWIKRRNSARDHSLFDSVRGVQKQLASNQTDAESTSANYLTAFGSDGFTVGSSSNVNASSDTYVAWNWLAGGTASSNTDGSITSSVSANTTAGFSIVAYTGNAISGATVGHGLGSAPKVVIVKDRDTGINSWTVGHESSAWTNYIFLNKTDATASSAGIWNNTAPTSSVFSLGNNDTVNGSGGLNIAYCFAEKKGYSKFGSYTGNGNADGTFIYTGFKPAWVMWKSTGIEDWGVSDSKRDTFNVMNLKLRPNSNSIESSSNAHLDFLSNGFKFRSTSGEFNGSGVAYIYMAFAENPFVTSTGIPTTAR